MTQVMGISIIITIGNKCIMVEALQASRLQGIKQEMRRNKGNEKRSGWEMGIL